MDEIAKQPRDTTKQLRDRIKDMTPLEEEMKKLERDYSLLEDLNTRSAITYLAKVTLPDKA